MSQEVTMNQISMLFSPLRVGNLVLKNRITMPPLYLGYANPDGSVSDIMVDHYREMAASGASLIVVENAGVASSGLGTPVMLRADRDDLIPGLRTIANVIHEKDSLAFLQINHAGRYAYTPVRIAPSPVKVGDILPVEMSRTDIAQVVEAFARAALRVKESGFDGVEVHGATGYLLTQFLSPRTNKRDDAYGGTLAKRMRFPLEVVEAVKAAVGKDYPVGYRFIAEEFLPDGFHVDEAQAFAKELETRGVAYLSVAVGAHEAFQLPEYIQLEKREAGRSEYAGPIKTSLARTPVITAGRIQTPQTAEAILREGRADLIGLGRILFADPLWPKKAAGEIGTPIVPCNPQCSLCLRRSHTGRPAICSQWEKDRRDAFLKRIHETGDGTA